MKAFPEVEYVSPGNGMGAHIMTIHGGMELRDYFAAKALGAMGHFYINAVDNLTIAQKCYGMADAMLKAREL